MSKGTGILFSRGTVNILCMPVFKHALTFERASLSLKLCIGNTPKALLLSNNSSGLILITQLNIHIIIYFEKFS